MSSQKFDAAPPLLVPSVMALAKLLAVLRVFRPEAVKLALGLPFLRTVKTPLVGSIVTAIWKCVQSEARKAPLYCASQVALFWSPRFRTIEPSLIVTMVT